MRLTIATMTFALAVVGAVVASGRARSLQDAPQQPAVDRIFGRYSASTPGCAVGAAVNGQTVVRAAYGMADLEHNAPNTPETVFEVGSVSKQFTAAAVLLLARDGKLSLDDDVRRFIPELPDYGVPITIRQMLHHTSGLRDWGNLVASAGAPRTTRLYTQAHVLDILSRQRALDFSPGTRWSYSNSGYNLAALIVSRVSGTSFDLFTKTRLFDPLGMTHSRFLEEYRTVVKGRAVGYSPRDMTFIVDMPNENAYGNRGLLTTVDDLLKWNENFTTHTVGDARFTSDMEERTTLADGRRHEYALGLYVDTYRGIREIDHSGGIAGYSAHLGRYPDQRLSVAVLCNDGDATATAYAKRIATLFLTGLQTTPEPQPSYALTEAEATRLTGLYRATAPIAVARVIRDDNGLVVQGVARLVATSATTFTGDEHRYDFSKAGHLSVVDEFGTVDEYDRIEPVTLTPEQLSEFTGRYFSGEIDTTLMLTREPNGLALRLRPDIVVQLTPVSSDFFSSAYGWLSFRRDARHRIVGFSVAQVTPSRDRGLWDLRFERQDDLQ